MAVEVLIEDPRWEAQGISALAQRAVDAALTHLGLDALQSDVSILACDDARIAVLNADFRHKPTPTNVLSWPAEDLAPNEAGAPPCSPKPDPDGMIELGDVAISYDTCAAEAADQNKPFSAHVTHLLVHGLLHLLGYDHIRDLDATLMEGIEIEILGKMGVDNPYRNG